MIVEFLTNHVFMSSILLLGAVSLLLQAGMTVSLKGYVKASANMKTTRKKLLINLKNQFETIYGMDYQIRNIAAYVDKYLLKMRFLGFSFSAWERVPFLTAGIATLLAGGEAFYGYMTGVPVVTQMEIVFAYGIVLACLFVFFHIFGIKSRKQQIQIQLVDYLENYLTNRLIRNRESTKEWKLLDESMEHAFMEGAARNEELKDVILEKDREEDRHARKARHEKKEAARKNAEYSDSERGMEEDMEMLRRLLREMSSDSEQKQQIAVSKEQSAETGMVENIAAVHAAEMEMEGTEEEEPASETEISEIELLEEFVQSFLA